MHVYFLVMTLQQCTSCVRDSFFYTHACLLSEVVLISLCITRGKAEKRPYKTTNIVNCKLTKGSYILCLLCMLILLLMFHTNWLFFGECGRLEMFNSSVWLSWGLRSMYDGVCFRTMVNCTFGHDRSCPVLASQTCCRAFHSSGR